MIKTLATRPMAWRQTALAVVVLLGLLTLLLPSWSNQLEYCRDFVVRFNFSQPHEWFTALERFVNQMPMQAWQEWRAAVETTTSQHQSQSGSTYRHAPVASVSWHDMVVEDVPGCHASYDRYNFLQKVVFCALVIVLTLVLAVLSIMLTVATACIIFFLGLGFGVEHALRSVTGQLWLGVYADPTLQFQRYWQSNFVMGILVYLLLLSVAKSTRAWRQGRRDGHDYVENSTATPHSPSRSQTSSDASSESVSAH
jgi:hypothetical protein